MNENLKRFFGTWYGNMIGSAVLAIVTSSVCAAASALVGGGPVLAIFGFVMIFVPVFAKWSELCRDWRFDEIVKEIDKSDHPSDQP